MEITPANPVPVYSLVRVETEPDADVWVLSIRGGTIVPVDIENCSAGVTIFTGPPGSYAILGKESTGRFQKVVIIGDAPVPPPTPPEPTPEPVPPPTPPEPEDAVTAAIQKLYAEKVPESARSKTTDVANVYRSVANRIGSDLHTQVLIRDETRSLTTRTLGTAKDAWVPFFDGLAKLLYAWSIEEQRDASEYKEMWLTVATALESVRGTQRIQ